jgi:hypothetical protein
MQIIARNQPAAVREVRDRGVAPAYANGMSNNATTTMPAVQLGRVIGICSAVIALLALPSIAQADDAPIVVQPATPVTPAPSGPVGAALNQPAALATPSAPVEQLPPGCRLMQDAGGSSYVLCPQPGGTLAPAGPLPGSSAAGPAAPAKPSVANQWYGWQNMLVDGSVLVASIGIAASSRSDSAGTGAGVLLLVGYGVGSPIVHGAHGNSNGALASMGLRVGAPLVGGAVGFLLGSDRGSGDVIFGGRAASAALGVGLGIVGAMVIDYAVLAYEPGRSPAAATAKRTPAPRGNSVHYTPNIGFDGRTARIGVGGTF